MSERKTGSGERQDAEQPEAAQQNEPQGPTLKFPELPERRSLMGGVMFRKKHDVSTMIFSALLTIVPLCLGILLLMGFLLLLIFRAL